MGGEASERWRSTLRSEPRKELEKGEESKTSSTQSEEAPTMALRASEKVTISASAGCRSQEVCRSLVDALDGGSGTRVRLELGVELPSLVERDGDE